MMVTDNYLRRSYNQLQQQLHPDTVYFLGDLFDGGREWKPMHGDFKDPEWSHRPKSEQKWAKKWNKKYGERYWLREYARFGDIFFNPWNAGGAEAGAGQRGRRLIASLPGNHDLGFGSEIHLGVRNRFECYFGEGNRVDVIGNHSFVSVDSVSLSADSSNQASQEDVNKIYKPTQDFLEGVQREKKKAIARELRYQNGDVEEVPFQHRIEDLAHADFSDVPQAVGADDQADLPTVLLTHVPLWRDPGTPCGPLREHWPPAKPPKGQTEPVNPDPRNAISVSGGYQYQNVLTLADSARLVDKIGNVVHAFSGDDHDYCELTHAANLGRVREITVKSMSMAMGVPTPGFLMVSMYNPIDARGRPLPGAPPHTLQTHLCLLPQSFSTYTRYAALIVVCLITLAIRAFLVPVLNLQHFALEPEAHRAGSGGGSGLLPVFKAKVEDYDAGGSGVTSSSSSSSTTPRGQGGSSYGGKGGGGVGIHGYEASRAYHGGGHHSSHHKSRHSKGGGVNRWGWGAHEDRRPGPKIQIRSDDDFYDGGGMWKAAARRGRIASRSSIGIVGRELWTTVWRVAWMVVLLWFYLNCKG